MSTIKFDIQKFGGGEETQTWSAGVTETAVRQEYANFCTQLDTTEETIRNIDSVRAALEAGWSGQDREDYLTKFQEHTENVIKQIEEYRVAVGKEVDSIIEQWTEFQKGLIS